MAGSSRLWTIRRYGINLKLYRAWSRRPEVTMEHRPTELVQGKHEPLPSCITVLRWSAFPVKLFPEQIVQESAFNLCTRFGLAGNAVAHCWLLSNA